MFLPESHSSLRGCSPITVEHYLTIFGRGLGIEFEDRFKKFRLWQDPERVVAETTPCQRAVARLQLLPPHDPQFRRNRERVARDAEREHLILEWDLGYDEDN